MHNETVLVLTVTFAFFDLLYSVAVVALFLHKGGLSSHREVHTSVPLLIARSE